MATIFTNQIPDNANASDNNTSYELGMKFRSTQAGQITGIRYYKAPSETGTHVGKIWAGTGGPALATVTFTNETASGWQEQLFNSPISIQANTTYVVSVNCNTHFPITYDQLQNSIVNGSLSSVADGNNGVFGSAGNFPTNSYRNSNYFRDIVFNVNAVSTITKVGGDNQTGTAGTALPNPLVVKIKDGSGNPQSGVTVNFAVTSGGGSVSPTSAVTNASGQASTVLTLGAASGATDPVTNTVTATASGIGSVTFTATANPVVQNDSLTILTNQTPGIADASDGTSYELGMKFISTAAGKITAIRFLKPPSETGTHIGKIWAGTGGPALATVTFTNESVSGWQEQNLAEPLVIEANKVYVVSVNCNSNFSITYDQLASPIVNGPLRSVADGNNGVFGSPNNFPTSSYRNSNYFRDIRFSAGSTLIKVSGDNQSGIVGSTLPNNLVVQVNNTSGNPQSGVTVNFAVTSGGGSVSPTSAVTNANGQASTTLTLGAIPSGANNGTLVTATASGIGSVYFTATALPANSNPIVLENQKPGTTNWKITNQANNNEIAGYATATSINKGSSLGIKVSVATPGAFNIDIYRLGYYGGTGGRLITSSGSLNGITQPAFTITETSTRLGEANWSTSYTVNVGSNWTSGLYIAKLTYQATGKQSQVWFVVRDDSSNADILFQSSFTTYLAYSNSSGYSLYAFNSTGGQRAFKVSYDLPFSQTTTQTGEFNNLLRWEYNMVRWLESQGYDVAYVTNMDVHSNSALLQQHKIFMSVGHDEYWSMEARNHVEQARDGSQAINLTFFSANTCYWRVRFDNSSTGQANRVMACYKDNWDQDSVAPTNKFRSPQNNKPENALLGVMYTGDRDSVYAGYDFVVTNSTDPYYAHTGLEDGDSIPLLVGFEWDAVINNGASPNGLVVLSQSPVDPQNIDTDVPPGTDYQISNAVRYTTANGAKVFATGSIQWAWGLDSDSVITPREDIRAQQITVNILKDMGAIPTTPGAGIIVS
ncbi:DUF4082 domain-containing protein [Nostoc sp. CHAB 5844]|nr:DUF4082 domain-containing protein [Nostoc sp. CHAB 5844]